VKQYTNDSDKRIVHNGIDIYVNERTKVYSPITGIINSVEILYENTIGLIIDNEKTGQKVILGNINFSLEIIGKKIKAGELIGNVVCPVETSRIQYSTYYESLAHLHFEYAEKINSNQIKEKSATSNDWIFKNALYESKMGKIYFVFGL